MNSSKRLASISDVRSDVYANPFMAFGHMTEVVQETIENRIILRSAHAKSSPSQTSLSPAPSPKRVVRSPNRSKRHEHFERTPWYLRVGGFVSYFVLFCLGLIREAIWGHGPIGKDHTIKETNRKGYVPLYASFESFYLRNIFRRQADCFNRPIVSVPGGKTMVTNRVTQDHGWTFKMADTERKEVINLASYNYLGYAENSGPCTEAAIEAIHKRGLGSTSPRSELGTSVQHRKLEQTVAKFLGAEDSICLGMGFATNSLNLPCLAGKGTLVVSDERNHASLILGLRLSGATVKVFKHNNMESLERLIRRGIIEGQPRTCRPYKRVIIAVEGIYSMEGSIVRLPEVVAIKRKYGAYIYLDEAHSVGAMGPNGRGVLDYFGINPKDIDVLMGTFTKSFGSAGGYIAGSKSLINHLRVNSQCSHYPISMSAPVMSQIIASMNDIMDKEKGDGMRRINQLARNSRYFRQKLQQMGCIVYGHDDSPVVPVMLFMQAKITALVHGLYDRNIATIGVGYPATEIAAERTRFCVSASHTQEMLDECLQALEEVAGEIHIKYSRKKRYNNADIVY
ncbi:serine palmitoyltransferase 2-like [Tigriopus californicus]|uniref:serine palmitoyltransferase 2-like n=1 Tax=Tigriopus californicus TaxID=6832 RepID=UPI0027DA3D15|nr:serine palmitoyltransferase 2-like [Tigriopus californicus]